MKCCFRRRVVNGFLFPILYLLAYYLLLLAGIGYPSCEISMIYLCFVYFVYLFVFLMSEVRWILPIKKYLLLKSCYIRCQNCMLWTWFIAIILYSVLAHVLYYCCLFLIPLFVYFLIWTCDVIWLWSHVSQQCKSRTDHVVAWFCKYFIWIFCFTMKYCWPSQCWTQRYTTSLRKKVRCSRLSIFWEWENTAMGYFQT